MKCPDCDRELAVDAIRCRCGWKAGALPDWPYDRCRVEVAGRRCLFPATFYPASGARPGTGECRLHDGVHGSLVVSIIEESEHWHDDRKRGVDVPLHYTRANGRKVPGYPSQAQLDREHVRQSAEVAAKLGLTTTAARLSYLHSALERVRTRKAPAAREREPGSDDE